MYARLTLLELDLVRAGLDQAVEAFNSQVLPSLREQEGFAGVLVLATPDGKGMIVGLWETEEAAIRAAEFASAALQRHAALFASPPGREYYEVAVAEIMP